uniref:Uncharacterized protein n=1 Tax=viral metagenome TaxID=1070528 RepID=A0A6M3L6P4_9ZZZZ
MNKIELRADITRLRNRVQEVLEKHPKIRKKIQTTLKGIISELDVLQKTLKFGEAENESNNP